MMRFHAIALLVVCGSVSLLKAQSYDFIRLDDPSLLPDTGSEFGWSSFQPPAMNASGDVAFALNAVGNRWAVFRSDGSAVTTIADTDSTPYITLGPHVSINDTGTVAMAARLTIDLLVVAGDGGPLTTIAQTQADGTTPTVNTVVSINNTGAVGYTNFYRDEQGRSHQSINVGSGGPLTTIVDDTDPNYIIPIFGFQELDDAGRVSFNAVYRTADEPDDPKLGSFVVEDGTVIKLSDVAGRVSINNVGQTAYSTTPASDIVLKSGDDLGIMLSSSLGIRRDGALSLNDLGRVAFIGESAGTRRLYLGSVGTTPEAILSFGDVVDGKVVTHIRLGNESLNNNGQIAARIMFEDGTAGYYRLDPQEFRWRNPLGGNWGEGANWSIGQSPGSNGVAAVDLAGTYTITTTQDVAAREFHVRRGDVTLGLSDFTLEVDNAVISSPTSATASLTVATNPTIVDGFVAKELLVGARGKVNTSGKGLYVGNVTLPPTGQEAAGIFAAVHARQSLVVQDGGQVDAFLAWVNGPAEPGGSGSAELEIAGADSRLTLASSMRVGNHRPDSSVLPEFEIFSTGQMTVRDGAQLTAGTDIVVDSPTSGSKSSMTAQGGAINSSRIIIGQRGHAELTISDSQLNVDTLIVGDFGRPSQYQDAASHGKVVIDGPEGVLGPYFGVIPDVGVGISGHGELIIRNGAQAQLLLGVGVSNVSHSAKGTVMIAGIEGAPEEQQTSVLAPSISIASDDRAGDGLVTISDGAVVGSQVVTVGVSPAAAGKGTLKLTDAGTRLSIGASLRVGSVSQGTLEVLDHAVVDMPLGVLTIGANGHGELRRGARIVAGGVNIHEGGVLIGDRGTLVCPEERINNRGTLRIGRSPGEFRIEGNYAQPSPGVLEIEIGGTLAIDEFDVLEIFGNAEIDGTILFRFIDGFVPLQGQEFEFLRISGQQDLSGATFVVENLSPEFAFGIRSTANGWAMTALSDGRVVPEPTTLVPTLLAAGLALRFVPRRRKP